MLSTSTTHVLIERSDTEHSTTIFSRGSSDDVSSEYEFGATKEPSEYDDNDEGEGSLCGDVLGLISSPSDGRDTSCLASTTSNRMIRSFDSPRSIGSSSKWICEVCQSRLERKELRIAEFAIVTLHLCNAKVWNNNAADTVALLNRS